MRIIRSLLLDYNNPNFHLFCVDYTGQFYVMMSPQDVLQGQRTTGTTQIRAATTGQAVSGKFNRDDRRRSTHNEVRA